MTANDRNLAPEATNKTCIRTTYAVCHTVWFLIQKGWILDGLDTQVPGFGVKPLKTKQNHQSMSKLITDRRHQTKLNSVGRSWDDLGFLEKS